MSNDPFLFGGLSILRDCKRIFVTAELTTSNGDPRVQPTGFPDVGPVYYPDPSGKHGQICLVESEASMANLLEEVCLSDALEEKATGTLRSDLTNIPYIRVFDGGVFKTSSTIDGHRFASEYIMKAKGTVDDREEELVEFVKRKLGSPDGKVVPAANVPIIYQLAMELDPMAIIHGFQISLKNKFTFVGCRSPRALTGCIVANGAEPVGIPGVRIDPIGTGDAGQAIFRKERIVSRGGIEAKFSIDVGLLWSLPLAGLVQAEQGETKKEKQQLQEARARLLIALSLWKTAKFLAQLQSGFRRRTECDLALKKATYRTGVQGNGDDPEFPFDAIVKTAAKGNETDKSVLRVLIDNAKFPAGRAPLDLKMQGGARTAAPAEIAPEGDANADTPV